MLYDNAYFIAKIKLKINVKLFKLYIIILICLEEKYANQKKYIFLQKNKNNVKVSQNQQI